MRQILTALILVTIASCSLSSKTTPTNTISATPTNTISAPAPPPKINRSVAKQICHAAMSAMYGSKPPAKYERGYTEDGKEMHVISSLKDPRYAWDCTVENNGNILYRSSRMPGSSEKGRWRIDPSDEKITVNFTKKEAQVTLSYSDGSTVAESYPISKLAR